MSDKSKIEWCDASWHDKSAAKRIGIPIKEYMAKKAVGLKWCTRCKKWHSLDRFGIDNSRGDGRSAKCLAAPKQLILPLTEAELRARDNERYRQYYAGKGGAAIRARVYARKRGIDPILPRHREILFETFEGQCTYCGEPATTIDHFIPVAKGGASSRGNILPACSRCNSSKRDRDPYLFIHECIKKGFRLHARLVEELCMSEVI